MFSYPNVHCVRITAAFSKHGIHFKYRANMTPTSVKWRTGELLEACPHCSLTWLLPKHCPKAALHVHEPWKPVCSLHLLSVHFTGCYAELQHFPTNPPFMLRAEKFFCRWLNLQHRSNSNVRQWSLLVPTALRNPRSAAQMNLVAKSEYSFVAKYPHLSTDCSQCISSSMLVSCVPSVKILLEHLSFKLSMLFLEKLNVYKI